MGILTTLINNLAGGAIDLGFRQLDNYITRSIEEGRDEDAWAAAQKADDWLKQQLTGANQKAGILPINNDPNMQMQIPQSAGLSQTPTGPMNLMPPAELMKDINKSNYASQYLYPRVQQYIQNDPYFVAQEQARKQQEAITNARSRAFGGLATQRDIGTETIGPGIMGKMDFSAPQLQESHATGQGLSTTATETAKEPFRKAALQRSIQLKQTPGARAMGTGGGDGTGTYNTVNPDFKGKVVRSLVDRYSQFRKQVMSATGIPMKDKNGKPIYEPAPETYAVADIAAEMWAGTKKPNYNKIETMAVQEYKKQRREQSAGKAPSLEKAAGGILRSPTAMQNLPKPTPGEAKETPLPTALPNIAPAPSAPASPAPSTTVTAQQMINAISKAKAAGESGAFIRDMIKAKGFKPEDFGY